MRKIFGLVLLILGFTLYAEDNPALSSSNEQARNLFFCPDITALKKDPDKRNWVAPNGWQSYGVSFVENIKSFLGAQWAGTQVGQMTCVYKGTEEHSFPILLIFHALTLEPEGDKWTKNLGGYRNCLSDAQEDCPFKMRLAPESEDIYKEAEKLKQPAPNDSQPGT